MKPKSKYRAALFLTVLLAGGPAFGQTSPLAPPPPGDTTRQPVGQDPTVGLVPPASLSEDTPSGAAVPDACWSGQACQGYGRFWVTTEALLWWMKGERLPPLVTASPAGTPLNQAGVLGAGNTTVLFGNSIVNNNVQGGWQINTGFWLDQNRR